MKNMAAADMTALAMQRSYQLFKDSAGKMPTRAKPALAEWLAAWNVLKSPREKRWWLGDGIDLVNKAKALGYEGSSTKKCDVIVWLRSIPEDADAWVATVAEPTPVAKPPSNRRAVGAAANRVETSCEGVPETCGMESWAQRLAGCLKSWPLFGSGCAYSRHCESHAENPFATRETVDILSRFCQVNRKPLP